MPLFDDLPSWLSGNGLLGPIVASLSQRQPPPGFAPPAPPEEARPLMQGPGVADRLMAAFQGFVNAPAPLPALGNLVSGLVTGQRGDAAGITQQQMAATYQMLRSRGLSDADARGAIANPAVLKALLPVAVPEYKPFSQGQTYGAFNPATGGTNIQGHTPTFQTLSPGQTGGFATPPAPGSRPSNDPTQTHPPSVVARANAPIVPTAVPTQSFPPSAGGFVPVATGGPEKPPPGYDYVDPRDPSKGLKVVPGGPATQLPGDVAGRLAMLEAARPALAEAKQYFTNPNGLFSGAGSFIGQAIGQRTQSFEIGRQQRNVRYAVETALRVATGAAAPKEEVANYADMYTPGVYDTLKTRQQKIEALERFVSYAERNMGAGRMPSPDTFMRPGTDKVQDRVPNPPPGFVRR